MERSESKDILSEKLVELEARGGKRLRDIAASSESDQVVGASGREYAVDTRAFWDTIPDDSDLYVEVTVSPEGSLLRRSRRGSLVVHPYSDEIVRDPSFPADRLGSNF